MTSLYVREAGAKDAPALVFLHGGGLSSAMWEPQFEQLSGDFYCLAPDLPEQGKSAAIGPFALDDAAKHVAEVINARVPARRAHVIGLSAGADLAIKLLSAAPEVVDHVIASGTMTRFSPFLAWLTAINEPFMRWLSPATQAKMMMGQMRIANQYYNLVLEGVSEGKPEFITHFAQEMVHAQMPTSLESPLLVCFGQREPGMVKKSAREFKAALPACTVAMAANLGHAWSMEDPGLFSAMVRAWVTDSPLPAQLQVW